MVILTLKDIHTPLQTSKCTIMLSPDTDVYACVRFKKGNSVKFELKRAQLSYHHCNLHLSCDVGILLGW